MTHFDQQPRPSDPRMVIVFVLGALVGCIAAVAFIVPFMF